MAEMAGVGLWIKNIYRSFTYLTRVKDVLFVVVWAVDSYFGSVSWKFLVDRVLGIFFVNSYFVSVSR
jgi:type IV secretory pathway VirB2 component (pilin)